ncbi:MAG TPA: cytochrome P450 [Candidatus Binatia bacterium]|nr:cytochrome P450 [Candidatus Binatia bacterium]
MLDIGVDLTNPDTFARGFPHDVFRRLRREAPVYWHEKGPDAGGAGFFVVSKYDDIKHVSRNPAIFSSQPGITVMENPGDYEAGQSSMLQMDPPRHARYRKLVSAGFTPRRIAEVEPVVRELVAEILDGVAARGRCDFVKDVAAELPLQVIARFLGVPKEDRHVLFHTSNRMIGFEDPEYGTSEEDGRAAVMELYTLAHRLAEERRKEPKDDIITVLLNSEVDGDRLSDLDFDAFFILLTIAGNETTRNQTSHGLRLLLENPEQLSRLRGDPSLLDSAVEEMLRYNPPVMYFRRTTTQDTEIRGVHVPAGSKVTVYYPSGNRDEDVFPEADRFDVMRSPNEHLAFGIGEHFCLGASLARVQLRSMLGEVVRRLEDIELDGEIRYLRSHFIDGVKEMPIRFRARA